MNRYNESMKKLVYGILSIVFFATLFVAACRFELFPQSFQIEYYVQGIGGTIEGSVVQSIQAGKDAKQVEAIPNDGYIFLEWSDGVKTAERSDTNITSDMTVYAKFGAELIEVDYKTANENGYIQGLTNQTVKYGQNATEVVAVPHIGYEFIGWSDGVKTAERIDTNVTSDITVYAKFKAQTINVKYGADEHGFIKGLTTQSVEYGQSTTKVEAVPYTGYEFVGWSDGIDSATRIDTDVVSPIEVTASFERQKLIANYSVVSNGYIIGKSEQDLLYGESAEKVTAVAEYGYSFVGWSDGVKTAERQDLNLKRNIKVTAKFKKITRDFTYDYKYGKATPQEKTVTLSYVDKETTRLAVPTREHFTFGGWYCNEEQVADSKGKVLEAFDFMASESTVLSAKWTANETFTYKVLMVYVTEIHAMVKTYDGTEELEVNYTMSDVERQICHNATILLSNQLNEMMEGLVEFQVDEYFTTEPVLTDDFRKVPSGGGSSFEAWQIDEIRDKGLLKEYKSFLTTLNLNDYNYKLFKASGQAGIKFGTIHLEVPLRGAILNKEPIENFLDLNYKRWDNFINTYMHELAHTIEMNIVELYKFFIENSDTAFHTWQRIDVNGSSGLTSLERMKMFYLDEAVYNGKKYLGIPYEFWTDDIELWQPYT